MPLNPVPYPVTNDAPTGNETAQVVRTIPRKKTFVETNTPLLANAVYTGPWHDTELDGTLYIVARSVSNQTAVAGGFLIQLSDDITNASLTVNGDAGGISAGANVLTTYPCYIRARYFRFVYTNGATNQGTWELTYTTFPEWMGSVSLPLGSTSAVGTLAVLAVTGAAIPNENNKTSFASLPAPTNGNANSLQVFPMIFGGAFNGTADTVRQGAVMQRTPTVFRQANVSGTGSTAVWTPGANNKFRLLRYRIVVSASAILGVAADLTIKLLDSAADIAQDFIVRIPAAALASGVNWDSGVCDLGQFGILSVAANNVLNANLSAALTGGSISIMLWGVEE